MYDYKTRIIKHRNIQQSSLVLTWSNIHQRIVYTLHLESSYIFKKQYLHKLYTVSNRDKLQTQ